MTNRAIEQRLKTHILLLDGAMGTMLQQKELNAEHYGGEEYEGCHEYLNILHPEIIESIHDEYFEAGADIVETNTFGGTPLVLNEYELGHLAYEINKRGAEVAKSSALRWSTPEHPRFVAGSMGPTTKTISVTGGITFDELSEHYYEQARGLIDGGVDVLLVETCQDAVNVKTCYVGIQKAFEHCNVKLPIIISGTIEPMGTTLAGQPIEAFYTSVKHMEPIAVGLNCATGPEFMADSIRSLCDLATTAVSCYPNAGLPDEDGHYHESPESLGKKLLDFANRGWLNIVGGCCGTTPSHIRVLREILKDVAPRRIPNNHANHQVSGIDPLLYDDSMRPLFVGERTNVIGSRKFKRLIAEEKYEEASEIARAQVKNGAHVIDICLADPDRDESTDMNIFMGFVNNKVKVPIMIDSTDEDVIESALKTTQGKCIINSINLEDGLERFEKIVPLAKRYGAALVVGTIDEKGMGVSRERKLEIATRSHKILTEEYGIPDSDIIFDPLVFPVGTGDPQYVTSAVETIHGIRDIKAVFPKTLSILGISNVSFGLPALGREVLNSVFLHECTESGLDYAIVNTEKLERFASISKEEIELSMKLLYKNSDENLQLFTEHFRGKVKVEKKISLNLSLEERLANNIVEGTKEGLFNDLQIALEKYTTPLDIINGPLMNGMNTVGKLFNDNQLIVAEVLQSAEVMKSAVAFLEPHMEKEETAAKGKVILATVKGDVHDIGKNLVDIILSNNGFDVVDLGIKVTPQTLIEAIRKEQPHMVGLSGLLVKSAQQMVTTAQDLKSANISVPILVGGAALTRKFTETRIAPEYEGTVLYAKDAMHGLQLANDLIDRPEEIHLEQQERLAQKASLATESTQQQVQAVATLVKVQKEKTHEVYPPRDTKRHVITTYPFQQILPYVNERMLLGHHLGLKGNVDKLLAEGDEKATTMQQLVREIGAQAVREKWFQLKSIYQFFPCQANGDTLIIYNPENKSEVIETFTFPRQTKEPFMCLTDYVKDVESGEMDYCGFFVASVTGSSLEVAKRWKAEGEYLRSHAILSLALETAEGLAERVHQQMRDFWGFSDSIDMTMKDRFAAKYQGQRFSFGYPACPNLEDQEKLFNLIRPEEIGVQLTEGFMMSPESSVTAIVFSHPEARYFMV